MRTDNEIFPSDEEENATEEIDQDTDEDESLINWRMVGMVFISMILIISIIIGIIGPGIIKSNFQNSIPTATPTPNPFIIGLKF